MKNAKWAATRHYMFVRFRSYTSAAMQVSIVETRRTGGKVRHEHVAGLGSIEMPPTVYGRVALRRAACLAIAGCRPQENAVAGLAQGQKPGQPRHAAGARLGPLSFALPRWQKWIMAKSTRLWADWRPIDTAPWEEDVGVSLTGFRIPASEPRGRGG